MADNTAEHYHVYLAYPSCHSWRGVSGFFTSPGLRYESRSAAHKAAQRKRPDQRYRLVLRCDFDQHDCPSRAPRELAERRTDR